MINPFQTLIDRIRGEVVDLDQVVQRASEVWLLARQKSDEQAIYLDSVALNLHSLYSGIERLFEMIADRSIVICLKVRIGIMIC